jgi:hypothetical protein
MPYTEIWSNVSMRMIIKASAAFFVPDVEDYLNIRYHAGP